MLENVQKMWYRVVCFFGAICLRAKLVSISSYKSLILFELIQKLQHSPWHAFLFLKVLTSAERKKKYIEKLKADGKYDDFLKKKAADERSRQQRIKIGLDQLPKAVREKTKRVNREYVRRQVAEYRARKRSINSKNESTSSKPELSAEERQSKQSPDDNGPYKTKSAWAKAVGKVKRSLPPASDKKKFVLTKVLRTFDKSDVLNMVNESHPNQIPKRKGLAPDVVDEIKTFYERDDISRISPNMRDCRKFKDPATGVKEIKQMRYLMYKLTDVYKLYLRHTQNGKILFFIFFGFVIVLCGSWGLSSTGDEQNTPVRLSKFSSLRPSHVKLVNSTPLDQCLCMYHSNFILCCNALHQSMPEFPVYGEELERLLLCENPTKGCWYRSCLKCVNAEKILTGILKKSGKKPQSVTMWHQWKKDNESNRMQKHVEKGTIKSLIAHFHNILPDFLKHSFIKRSQAARFEQDNEEVSQSKCDMASLQIDFAENFCCESQDEVQSAHWNQPSVWNFDFPIIFFLCSSNLHKRNSVIQKNKNIWP